MLLSTIKILNSNFKFKLEFTRCMCNFEKSHLQLFTTHFGFNKNKAINYIHWNRLGRIPPSTIVSIVHFCENIGFQKNDIFKNPILLRMHLSTLDQYYTVMTEGGFHNITPEILSKFRTHYKKKIIILKKQRFIKPEVDVAKSFISCLSPCPENFHVKTEIDDTWTDVHLKVLSEYLKWRLQATDAEVSNLIKVYTSIRRKSFKYICENIKVSEGLGFKPRKLLKYGYILHAYPTHTKEVLEKYPTLAGFCMRKAMRMYPKLMTTSPTKIERIYNILKEHNIPDEAICKRMNVLHLAPETVEFRLKELEKDEDMKVLFHNPNVLKLVIHHNRAKSRLSFLKQLQLRCTSVSVLGNDDNKFDIHIREGKDANTLADTYAFLKGIFQKGKEEFESKLKKHPYYLQVPLKSMEETYDYLRKCKYTNTAIFDVIYILLYPKEKLVDALEQVKEYENQNKKLLNPLKRLNLALYFIEREHHFTGDGVWTKTESIEESAHAP